MRIIPRNIQLQQIAVYIRSSLWFVPAVIVLSTMLLAILLVELDHMFYRELRGLWPKMLTTGAEGARSMLSTIAGSMATVAGVVFSITIVALALASSQYSPRVLRNFMRDRATQVVLGVFIGIYLYCLLVLRTISGSDSDALFVPSLSVLGALLLAIAGVGFFIFFIHHISTSIQASEMIAAITRETMQAIDKLFPEEIGAGRDEAEAERAIGGFDWQPVQALEMGYIQSVDVEALLSHATSAGTVIRMECGIGDFIAPGRPLVSVAAGSPVDDDCTGKINNMFAIGSYRTIDQDAAFGIRQLVDISLKALSPGINDTTTATTCIQHLGALLSRCAQRCMPEPYRHDGGVLRVIARAPVFADLVSLSFNQILEHARGNSEVLLHLLASIEKIATVTTSSKRLQVLRHWTNAIEENGRRTLSAPHTVRAFEEHLRNVRLILNGKTMHSAMPC